MILNNIFLINQIRNCIKITKKRTKIQLTPYNFVKNSQFKKKNKLKDKT